MNKTIVLTTRDNLRHTSNNNKIKCSLITRIFFSSCCPTCLRDCLLLLAQQPYTCACPVDLTCVYFDRCCQLWFLEECISMTQDPQHQCLLNCIQYPLRDQNYTQLLLHANNWSDNIGLTLLKKIYKLSGVSV